jgi:hypothetical protein
MGARQGGGKGERGKNPYAMPLSVICESFSRPSLIKMSICVEFASIEFSISSFNAFEERWTTSRVAILSVTYTVLVGEEEGTGGRRTFCGGI